MEKIDQALRILYQRYSMGDLKKVEDILTYAIPCHRGAHEEQHARLVHVPGAATREDVIAIANMFEGTVEERAARMAKIVLGNPDTNQDISDLIDMSFDPGLKCDKEGRICHGNTDYECKLCVARPSYSGRTSQAAERAPDSCNSSGETSADRTPPLPTVVFDSAQRYPTPELNYEISPIPPPRGLSHTFWSVQRWEIGLNKEGLHSAK